MSESDSLEQRAYNDLDIIAETAKDGLDALEHTDMNGVRSALESIRDRAGAWDDPE